MPIAILSGTRVRIASGARREKTRVQCLTESEGNESVDLQTMEKLFLSLA